ncbi:hypothetical protein AXF42_Ash019310 [Apostasia shenzhenica]|uniref:DEP domain-containing protein n=1 Tax=Apostasia shenzhenica TaxID=1088818 RepID=A0A2I0ARB1_9ASPA|nr:hypothetical protein AXF42_Ash019310 [Apostasia shenzhenica]
METRDITADEDEVHNASTSDNNIINRDRTVKVNGNIGSNLTSEQSQIEKPNLEVKGEREVPLGSDEGDGSKLQVPESNDLNVENKTDLNKAGEEEAVPEEEEEDPVFDGTEASEPFHDPESDVQVSAWPEKAVAIKNFVKEKGSVAMATVLRRLSGKKGDDYMVDTCDQRKSEDRFRGAKDEEDSSTESKLKEVLVKAGDISTWNPLNYIKIGRETDTRSKSEQAGEGNGETSAEDYKMMGRVIAYTKLGCQACREVRTFFHQKQLRYVEINIDIYPTRKLELEKNTGSSIVPRVYFNEVLIGGLDDLMTLEKSGKLDEMINILFNEDPSSSAPMPPLPGEDDVSGSGKIDELAAIVRKMKESIVLKDRYYKMRRFSNCFLGSEAVDFLSEDQYLEREEAIEFGRKLGVSHFFRHVLDENVFEDGNHLYRFLEHDPVANRCQNVPHGTIDVEPKLVIDVASRLRLLSYAIFEAYVSEDGRHVDYKSIHASEEFKRYLRIIEDLQRVDMDGLSREDKLAFFINLYNMMVIHAVLTCGYPVGPLDRRKFLGDFKYVIGGSSYSLSAIENGILRGNQRPPYNLKKPFGLKDKRFKIALPYPEPLVHFALVSGTRSGPSLRCYSPRDIDKELVDAARNFLRNGGIILDAEAKVISVSKILRWYNVDFGKNEVEVLKHAANYLEPTKSEQFLELLANTQLKVIYQPYDWGLNF